MDVTHASFALDIPILLPLLGAFTVLLASRKLRIFKIIIWISVAAYLYFIDTTLLPKLMNNPVWQARVITACIFLSSIFWFSALFFLVPPKHHRYRIDSLIILNAFLVVWFWMFSGSLYFGYANVPDFFPEPIRSLIFANGTPQWLKGPIFVWRSGTEAWPIATLFILSAILLTLVYIKTKKWILLALLLPIILIFIPLLHTDWMALLLFGLYPIVLVYLGVTKIGYTLFGSFEKETGFFGNMENSTGVIPPPK